MDVAFGVLLVAGLWTVGWLFVEALRADRRDHRAAMERIDRTMRSLMFRRCQRYWADVGLDAAMDRVAGEADRREGTL